MKLVLTGGHDPEEFVLVENASGIRIDDATIYDREGREIANWAFCESGAEGWVPELHGAPEEFFSRAELRPAAPSQTEAMRLYLLLALFDSRTGHPLDDLVRSAREGFERSGMDESEAWEAFDGLWGSFTSSQRLDLVRDRHGA